MIRQLAIIIGMLVVGHVIVSVVGLRVPPSIVGMILLAVLLKTRCVAPDSVKDACHAIIGNLGFFFIPPGVALMVNYDIILAEWPVIVVATVVSTMLVMIVTACAHSLLRSKRMKGGM